MARRNKKGSVAVHNRRGMLRLRWSYLGQSYSFAMGLPDNPVNRAAAEAKAAEIQKDLAFHEFDPTLDKYRPKPPIIASETAELFQQFIDHKIANEDIAKQTASSVYAPLLSHLKQFGTVRNRKQAEKLLKTIRKTRSPASVNSALCRYQAFGRWAVQQGYMAINPFEHLKSLRVPRSPTKRQPFTPDEIKRLLTTIAKHEQFSHYYDFCLFLFSLGVRPSEAIGLRWGSVNLDAKQVTISEVLVRCDRNGGQLRKGTKNDVVRILNLSEGMINILRARQPAAAEPDDLVFKAPKGKPINNDSFRRYCWKPACKAAGIPYRPPYTTRHTLISYGIEFEGWSFPQAAQIAGDSVATIIANYAHPITPPSMPDFKPD